MGDSVLHRDCEGQEQVLKAAAGRPRILTGAQRLRRAVSAWQQEKKTAYLPWVKTQRKIRKTAVFIV
jgi:hypothetical protein